MKKTLTEISNSFTERGIWSLRMLTAVGSSACWLKRSPCPLHRNSISIREFNNSGMAPYSYAFTKSDRGRCGNAENSGSMFQSCGSGIWGVRTGNGFNPRVTAVAGSSIGSATLLRTLSGGERGSRGLKRRYGQIRNDLCVDTSPLRNVRIGPMDSGSGHAFVAGCNRRIGAGANVISDPIVGIGSVTAAHSVAALNIPACFITGNVSLAVIKYIEN